MRAVPGRLGRRLGDAARSAARDLRDAGGSEPIAAYARVLDGRHLWLAVDAPGLGGEDVRLLHEGADVTPPNDAPADPAYLSLRWDLDALPGDDGATYAVVAGHRPVRAGDLPEAGPMRTPPDPEGRWQYDVRTDDGILTLGRRAHAVGAEIEALETDGAEVVLRMSDPGATDRPEIRLRSTDGHAAT